MARQMKIKKYSQIDFVTFVCFVVFVVGQHHKSAAV